MRALQITIVILCLLSCLQGGVAQTLTYNNETLAITLLIDNMTCEGTEKVFRIERINYTSDIDALEFPYIYTLATNTGLVVKKNNSKTINKYTQSNTGNYLPTTNEQYYVTLETQQEKLTWKLYPNCFVDQDNTTSEIENNTTNNESTNSIVAQEHNSSTTNNTTINTTNNTTIKNTEELHCTVWSNKNIYAPKEQMHYTFNLSNTSTATTITYWIEDLAGNTIKTAYTTTNTLLKTYTFKTQEESEKAYLIKATVQGEKNASCEQLVLVKQDTKREESKTNIIIETVKPTTKNESNYEAKIIIEKGATTKSVINCMLQDNELNSISDKQKIKLNTQGQVEATLNFYTDQDTATSIFCEGLGISNTYKLEESTITTQTNPAKIIRTYTKQEYLNDNLTWYVRLTATEKTQVRIWTINENHSKTTDKKGEHTISFTLKKPEANMIIITELGEGEQTEQHINHITLKTRKANENTNEAQNNTSKERVNVSSLQTAWKSPTGAVTAVHSEDAQEERKTAKIVAGTIVLLSLGILAGAGPKQVYEKFIKS